METWLRFDSQTPSEGQYIVAITQRDQDEPVEVWELELERNAVGIWLDGVVWEGNRPREGFTHWCSLPERPSPLRPSRQLDLWESLVSPGHTPGSLGKGT